MLNGKLKSAVINADGSGRLTIDVDGKDHVVSIPASGIEQLGSRGIIHRGPGRINPEFVGSMIELHAWTSWRLGGQSGRGDRFANEL